MRSKAKPYATPPHFINVCYVITTRVRNEF